MLRHKRGFSFPWPTRTNLHAGRTSAVTAAAKRILVVNGHPDPRPERFCAALCAAYAQGARSAAWNVRELAVGALATPLRPGGKIPDCEASADVTGALELMQWADRLAIVFPLWLGRPPAPLTQFFDHAAEWSSALRASDPKVRAIDRPARIVVTMEMPAFAYRLAFRANSPLGEEIMRFAGIREPVVTCIGSIDAMSANQRAGWLDSARGFGLRGV
jgi:putative NADPH-quinone reductase